MIYDGFLFFNELDLLEVRLNTLATVVDKFVLIESDETISGDPKPLYYADNKERFAAFKDKIIHVIVRDMPPTEDRWVREWFQRDAMVRGLKDAQPLDIVMVGDVDEIPYPSYVAQLWNYLPASFSMKTYYYDLNHVSHQFLIGPTATWLQNLEFPHMLRRRRLDWKRVDNACWHFSCFGGPAAIAHKLASFTHGEYDTDYYKDEERLAKVIKASRDLLDRNIPVERVPIDNTLPQYILNNLDKFQHWIYPDERK